MTHRRHQRGKPVAASAQEHRPDEQPERYVRGASGRKPLVGTDVYIVDGTAHRMDGRCHDDCPNVV